MTSWTSDLPPSPYAGPVIPLRIEGVIPPEPRPAAGNYDVRLRLSRPLTRFEVRALQPVARCMHAVDSILTLSDTTLEYVATQSKELGALFRRAEEEGRRLEAVARQDENHRLGHAAEAQRLTSIAKNISFY